MSTAESVPVAEAAPATPAPDPLGLSGAPLQPLLDKDGAAARTEEARTAAAEAAEDRGAEDEDVAAGGPLRPLLGRDEAAARAEALRAERTGAEGDGTTADDASEDLAEDTDAEGEAEPEAAEGEADEAAEDFEIGVARQVAEPAFVAPLEREAGLTWLGTGKALLAQAQPAEAELAFRRSLALEGVSVEALTGAGIAAKTQGHLNAARVMLLRARDLAPDDVDVNNALGLVLKGLNDYPGAYQAFRAAFIVSSGTSEVAAANLEDARIRAAHSALVAPVPDSDAIAFDLSRTGPSEFLLHEPGTQVEAVLPPEEPVAITTLDEDAMLAIEEGADPAEVIAAAEAAEAAERDAVVEAAELEPVEEGDVANARAATEADDADADTLEGRAAPAAERDLEAEAALPPELLAVIEGAGGALAPLDDEALADETAPTEEEGGAAAALATNAGAAEGAVIEVEDVSTDDGPATKWTIVND
ncbi:MAG: hypothetical protein AAFP17_01705 [Pseudomonadota bacterium]